jgi:oxygen-dependent protoporphyrinogen oxidase
MLAMQKMAKSRGQQGPVGAGPGGALWSFDDGASELTGTLASTLEGHEIRSGVGVDALERADGSWRVRVGGEALQADAVVLAVPAYDAAALLAPFDAGVSDLLHSIPYVPAAVVCLGYRKEDVPHPLDGFGFLIPRAEGRRILGSRWDSSTFSHRAPDGSALLTQIVGGARDPQLVGLGDPELLTVVREEMEATMGIAARPAFEKVVRWKRAIPQYIVGHSKKVQDIEGRVSALGGVFLAGNAYYGIGINDCTAHASVVAPRVVLALGGTARPDMPRGGNRP